MVENITLNSFVVNPPGVVYEDVNFNRHSFFSWGELADKQSHSFLVNKRVCPKIGEAVSPEGSDVGQVSLVNRRLPVLIGTALSNLFDFFLQVFLQQIDILELVYFDGVEELDAGNINEDTSLDSPPA